MFGPRQLVWSSPSCHSIWQHCSSLLLGIVLFGLAQGCCWYASGEEKELQILYSCSNNPLTFFSPFHPKGQLTHVKPAGCLFSLSISGRNRLVCLSVSFCDLFPQNVALSSAKFQNSKKGGLSFNRNVKDYQVRLDLDLFIFRSAY